ncbi:MAG: chromate efflux transporter [Anaerolineales bacterium]|nr:chromate efflux transporter [Anaerolineales bacterium]
MQISLLQLFLKFLRFGFLAWGGPVSQIAMIRQELVEDEKWISSEKFNRVLAVYQALPGPEAHELCVYFGMIARGRIGALLAGLGFMLPGFTLMFALSWFYVSYGITSQLFQSAFLGMQPAVAALIIRAVHRIGSHALHENKWLWTIAILAFIAQLLDVNFLITLLISGFIFTFATRQNHRLAFILILVSVSINIYFLLNISPESQTTPDSQFTSTNSPNLLILLFSGLRAGLLTFGGAYTAIPFIQHDAVEVGRWMTNAQFLDGLALSGLLPAPLIIFSTFVGYIGGGAFGAIAMTIGVFAPAFSFTMIGHEYLEKLTENKSIHAFLDGITAGVIGLISVTALGILNETILEMNSFTIFSLALIILFASKSKWSTAWVVLGAGLLGLIFF